MNTEIANAVNAAGDKAQYDTRVKRLLAQKGVKTIIVSPAKRNELKKE